MNRFLSFAIVAFALLTASCANSQTLADRLAAAPGVVEVSELENTVFGKGQKFLLIFEQPIDHSNPEAGTFRQRVVVGNIHPDSATVVVTEGYGAAYAFRPGYRDEISNLFNTNNVVIEHRYFLESTPYPGAAPEEVNWDYLNAPNAAADMHNVVEALKTIYKGKWISTGISKGGQNTMIYRAYYPDDVDFSVPYVGPLCYGNPDGRHEPFIAEYAGTPEDRAAIKNFQIELLKRKQQLLPLYDSLCKAKGFEFNLPVEQVYDYSTLEYSFAFWQWGSPVAEIPGAKASDREVFNHFMLISSPDYWVNWGPTSPFFVQAAKELGYYNYDMKQFGKYQRYFSIKNTDNYMDKLFMPKGKTFRFDDYLYNKISAFLLTTDARMLFIYGQFDPWSAVMPTDPHRDNIRFFIQPDGSHRARIATFSPEKQEEIKSILSSWLYE